MNIVVLGMFTKHLVENAKKLVRVVIRKLGEGRDVEIICLIRTPLTAGTRDVDRNYLFTARARITKGDS